MWIWCGPCTCFKHKKCIPKNSILFIHKCTPEIRTNENRWEKSKRQNYINEMYNIVILACDDCALNACQLATATFSWMGFESKWAVCICGILSTCVCHCTIAIQPVLIHRSCVRILDVDQCVGIYSLLHTALRRWKVWAIFFFLRLFCYNWRDKIIGVVIWLAFLNNKVSNSHIFFI